VGGRALIPKNAFAWLIPLLAPTPVGAGFQGVRVLTLIRLLSLSSDFSTAHSNGTNKVIDTHGTSCYAPPCIPKLILAEVLPLHPQ
jgi:hypothetical protein